MNVILKEPGRLKDLVLHSQTHEHQALCCGLLGRFALLCGGFRRVCWIAEVLIERDRLFRQSACRGRLDRVSLAKLERRHLVLAALLQPRLDLDEALTAPEAEQHPLLFRANEQDGTVCKINEMTLFDHFVERDRSPNRLP